MAPLARAGEVIASLQTRERAGEVLQFSTVIMAFPAKEPPFRIGALRLKMLEG
jgi:hypothetical protein